MSGDYTRSDEKSRNVSYTIDLLKHDYEMEGQSSVENDDYDERQERNYGVEDF
jgi:hypothetical protein